MEFKPYRKEDLAAVQARAGEDTDWRKFLQASHLEALEKECKTKTIWYGDEAKGIFGATYPAQGRATVFTFLGDICVRDWTRLVRHLAREIKILGEEGAHRIEMTVDCEFENGCRLARLLGFEVEGRLKQFTHDRRDHFLFARVYG